MKKIMNDSIMNLFLIFLLLFSELFFISDEGVIR